MGFSCFLNWRKSISELNSPKSDSHSPSHKSPTGKKICTHPKISSNKNIDSNVQIMASPKYSSVPSAGELEAVFNKFDADGNGKISWGKLGGIMRCLGYNASDEELRLMVAEADSDGDGFIDLSEFIELNTKGIDSAGGLRELRDAFRIFDMDDSGSISADELHKVFESLGESCSLQDCHDMIRGVDCDGDGYVSFDEFMIMMTTSA